MKLAGTLSLNTLAMLVCVGTASAGPLTGNFSFEVWTANQSGTQFNADAPHSGFNSAGAISATFNYSGPLQFTSEAGSSQNSNNTGDLNSQFFSPYTSNISGYSGSGTLAAPSGANFTTVSAFLASSGSASGYQYGSLYEINLGTLAKGTVLTVSHDDGFSIYQNGAELNGSNPGPTVEVTDTVVLTSTSDTILWYARENGAPSVLDVEVPEPASLTLMGAGLAAFGFLRRRRSGK